MDTATGGGYPRGREADGTGDEMQHDELGDERRRLLPLESFAGGVGDHVAFAREVGERIARVALSS